MIFEESRPETIRHSKGPSEILHRTRSIGTYNSETRKFICPTGRVVLLNNEKY